MVMATTTSRIHHLSNLEYLLVMWTYLLETLARVHHANQKDATHETKTATKKDEA
jgi:hypothetical protein